MKIILTYLIKGLSSINDILYQNIFIELKLLEKITQIETDFSQDLKEFSGNLLTDNNLIINIKQTLKQRITVLDNLIYHYKIIESVKNTDSSNFNIYSFSPNQQLYKRENRFTIPCTIINQIIINEKKIKNHINSKFNSSRRFLRCAELYLKNNFETIYFKILNNYRREKKEFNMFEIKINDAYIKNRQSSIVKSKKIIFNDMDKVILTDLKELMSSIQQAYDENIGFPFYLQYPIIFKKCEGENMILVINEIYGYKDIFSIYVSLINKLNQNIENIVYKYFNEYRSTHFNTEYLDHDEFLNDYIFKDINGVYNFKNILPPSILIYSSNNNIFTSTPFKGNPFNKKEKNLGLEKSSPCLYALLTDNYFPAKKIKPIYDLNMLNLRSYLTNTNNFINRPTSKIQIDKDPDVLEKSSSKTNHKSVSSDDGKNLNNEFLEDISFLSSTLESPLSARNFSEVLMDIDHEKNLDLYL